MGLCVRVCVSPWGSQRMTLVCLIWSMRHMRLLFISVPLFVCFMLFSFLHSNCSLILFSLFSIPSPSSSVSSPYIHFCFPVHLRNLWAYAALWFSPRCISPCTTQQRSRKVDWWCCSRLQLNRLVKSPSTNHSTLDHSYLNYCCWKWSLSCLWLAARRVDSVQCSHFQPLTETNTVIIIFKSNTMWFFYDNLSLL